MKLVAVTSNDGITVNEHFGKATSFFVYKYYDDGVKFLEERKVSAYCGGENYATDPNTHSFEESKFERVYKVIKDVDALYTKKIGDTPMEKLVEKGIEVQLCSCSISDIANCGGKCPSTPLRDL